MEDAEMHQKKISYSNTNFESKITFYYLKYIFLM